MTYHIFAGDNPLIYIWVKYASGTRSEIAYLQPECLPRLTEACYSIQTWLSPIEEWMGSTQDGDGGESATMATLHFLESGPGSREKPGCWERHSREHLSSRELDYAFYSHLDKIVRWHLIQSLKAQLKLLPFHANRHICVCPPSNWRARITAGAQVTAGGSLNLEGDPFHLSVKGLGRLIQD